MQIGKIIAGFILAVSATTGFAEDGTFGHRYGEAGRGGGYFGGVWVTRVHLDQAGKLDRLGVDATCFGRPEETHVKLAIYAIPEDPSRPARLVAQTDSGLFCDTVELETPLVDVEAGDYWIAQATTDHQIGRNQLCGDRLPNQTGLVTLTNLTFRNPFPRSLYPNEINFFGHDSAAICLFGRVL